MEIPIQFPVTAPPPPSSPPSSFSLPPPAYRKSIGDVGESGPSVPAIVIFPRL